VRTCQTVYIDKDIPHSMKAGGSYDPARTLPLARGPEWYLMHEKGLSYQEATRSRRMRFEKPRLRSLAWTGGKLSSKVGEGESA